MYSSLDVPWESPAGIDPAKIVVMGDSSGGNLAAGTATLHRDDRELDKHSFPSIAAQVATMQQTGIFGPSHR